MTDPDISVVVPTRNRASLVSRLLQQLARIDDELTYEVIVVDEGSSDATPAMLHRFAAEHGFRILRHDPPRGLSGARNAGLDAARGTYIAWIDDDDLTSTDRLRRQHDALVTTGARWSCSARIDVNDDLEVIGHMRCPPNAGFAAAILRSNVLPTAAQGLLVDRALASEVGAYDEALTSAEDWDFCIRLAAVAEPHFLDEPLVAYRTGVPSMSTDTAHMEETIRQVIAKYPDRYAALGVEPDWAKIHFGLLNADLSNSRRQAADRAFRAFRAGPSARTAVRTGLALLSPSRFATRARRLRIEQVPEGWADRARAWLSEVPRGDPG